MMTKSFRRLVEADVLFDPTEVTLFGAIGIVLDTESLADLFEQFHASPS